MAETVYHYSRLSGPEPVFTCHAARVYPRPAHTRHWTAGFVAKGRVRLQTVTENRTLGEGDSFVIPSHVVHALRMSDDTIRAVCVSIRKKTRVFRSIS